MKGPGVVISIASLLLLLVLVRACARDRIDWKEEVRLHDGKVIVVKRSMTVNSGRFEPGARMLGEANYRLQFAMPDGKVVSWSNPGDLRIMILDFDNGTPYLAAEPAMVSDFRTYGCPKPPYVFLKFDGEWSRIHFPEFPQRFTLTNLSPSTEARRDMARSGYLSVRQVAYLLADLDQSAKQIDTAIWSPGCPLKSEYN